jgi:hypothetical protein
MVITITWKPQIKGRTIMGYLIAFVYDHYCQGYEDSPMTVLVYADTFDNACEKIKVEYLNARYFKNRTVR